jgi:tetratricopeptide (TPR) repeat protein
MRKWCGGLLCVFRRPRWLITALCVLAAAALAFPHASGWYHWRAAQSSLARFHDEQALVHLQTCLEIWPDSAAVHLLASRAARRTDRFEEAFSHWQACKRLQTDLSDEVELEDLLLHAASGDLKRHIEFPLLDRAKKDLENAPLILEALAEGYLRCHRILEASACLERWLTLAPDNAQVYYLRGKILAHTNRSAKAVPDYQRALELDLSRDDVRSELARALLEAGRYEEALAHLDYLRPRRPGDTSLEVRRARCHKGLSHLQEARQILDLVLEEHPEDGLALRTRGEVDQLAGRYSAAEKWLCAAARVLPRDYATQWALHKFYLQQGKTDEARRQLAVVEHLRLCLEKLETVRNKIAVQPNNPALHCQLGTIFLELGETTVGEVWLRNALARDPQYAPAHTALAQLYQSQGDETRAALHREQAKLAAPGHASGRK